MKRVLALVLLSLPALVSAGGRCPSNHAIRDEPARLSMTRVIAARNDTIRLRKQRAPVVWRLLLEQQIL